MKTKTKATRKIKILSPDGFTLERDVPYYNSHRAAAEAFAKWKKNYEIQGYYSSVKYGRIHLCELEDYCQLNYL